MIIKVKVKAGSSKQEIENFGNNNYLIYLKEPSENNRANIELLKLLKRYFGKDVKLVKGLKSKNKIVEIE